MRFPKSVYLLEDGDKYIAIFTARREIAEFKPDSIMKETIDKILNNEETGSDQNVKARIESLKRLGLVLDYEPEESKFMKQELFLSEYLGSDARKVQERLQESSVAVFGIGGIGTWIVNGLSQIGVGDIRVVDPDIVSLSNLNRQLHFSEEDIGEFKVEVIKKKLPNQSISPYRRNIDSNTDLSDIIEGTDFVFDCADFPSVYETARIIDSFCRDYAIAYSVAGGYNMHLGMVGPTIIPGETGCFDCFASYQKENDPLSGLRVLKDVEDSGNLGPIAGVIANFHVMEAFKYLTGIGTINRNKFLEIDFFNMNFEWREFYKRDDCQTCSST